MDHPKVSEDSRFRQAGCEGAQSVVRLSAAATGSSFILDPRRLRLRKRGRREEDERRRACLACQLPLATGELEF